MHLRMVCGFTLVVLVLLPVAHARELLRLTIDLDGDNKPDLVTLTSAEENASDTYYLRVGSAPARSYQGGDDLPAIKPIQLDPAKKTTQLLVTHTWPGACYYHMLALQNKQVVSLLEISTTECKRPTVLENGHVEVSYHYSFWQRRDRYKLNPNHTKLVFATTVHPVNAQGVASKSLVLTKAECASSAIEQGKPVAVISYDSNKESYYVKSENSSCGWISEKNIAEEISGLPWAC